MRDIRGDWHNSPSCVALSCLGAEKEPRAPRIISMDARERSTKRLANWLLALNPLRLPLLVGAL